MIAPTLPGMGGDEAALRAVTLQGWGAYAAQQCVDLKAELGGAPVVLAGHSRGGLVVSTAAEQNPEAMDALVYICAMMLPEGMSRAAFKALEEPNPAFDALISPIAGGAGTVVDPTRAAPVFAQLSPPDLVAAALPRLLAEPHGPRATPIMVTPERWGRLPRTYVECTQDRTIPITSQRKMQAMSPGAKVVTLESDHSPYLCCPRQLAEALIGAIPAA